MWNCWSFTCFLSWTLFFRYYFGRCSSELAQLVPLPLPYSTYSTLPRASTRYSDKLRHFSVTIPGCYKDAYANSFFPCTTRLWNSLEWSEFQLKKCLLRSFHRFLSYFINNLLELHLNAQGCLVDFRSLV